MAKKTLFVATFLAITLFPTIPTYAQTTPATTQDVADLEATIRQLLLQLIAQLQQQLTDLIASQVQTNQVLGAVQTQVNAVVQNTAPTPKPVTIPTPVVPVKPPLYPVVNGVCGDLQPCVVLSCSAALSWKNTYGADTAQAEDKMTQYALDRVAAIRDQTSISLDQVNASPALKSIYDEVVNSNFYRTRRGDVLSAATFSNELVAYYCQ